ncbi:hypothetical protein ACFL1X_09995, partial [Candidatus Hydrogenedentota bacterium]
MSKEHKAILFLMLLAMAPTVGCASTGGPFEIVKSFPVSEPTWGAKWNDLYIVAAQRSMLVFRKTGP